MNREMIFDKVKPFLNDRNELYEEDFNKLFYMLRMKEKKMVIGILVDFNVKVNYGSKPNKINTTDTLVKRTLAADKNKNKPILDLSKLTNEQLCLRYQSGDKESIGSLFKKNEGYINKIAYRYEKYYNQQLAFDDLKEEAVFGLIKAAEKYDHTKDFLFLTYAGHWIEQSISRAVMDKGFTIRIPVHKMELVNKVYRVLRDNQVTDNMDEAYKCVSEYFEISEENFEHVMVIMHNLIKPASLDVPVGEDATTKLGDFIIDTLTSVEESVEELFLDNYIEEVLACLKEKERDIVIKRFGLFGNNEMTLEEIGQEYNVSRERIRQIEAKAINKLKHPIRRNKLKGFLEV
jgi:RNA polymerase primary sigma factor